VARGLTCRLPADARERWRHLSDEAFRVHIEGYCYCAGELTDGFIPKAEAKTWGKVVGELTQKDAWLVVEDGFRIPDYLDWNPKRAAVEGERAAARERMKKLRSARDSLAPRPTKKRESESVALPPAPAPAPPEAVALCDLLADLIEANGSKRPTVTEKWKNEARLLLATGRNGDGRPYAEAVSLIRWCQADAFWNSNIMSMPKFRQRYDRLRLQAQNGGADLGNRFHAEQLQLERARERLPGEIVPMPDEVKERARRLRGEERS
jgi:hypothetical protein